jgi:hypothetical protein
MKIPSEDNTFLVSGYLGTSTASADYFEGYCIAEDKGSAIALMSRTIPTLNPHGATSLAEVKRYAAALEKVMRGDLSAPRQNGFAAA